MPQVSTSSEAGPGTKIIYCIIIHICLWWNIYMRMDNSLVHFIRVAWGTLRRWFTQTIPPASSLIYKWSRCSSSLPLIGRRAGPWLGDTRRGDRRKFFFVIVAFDSIICSLYISLVITVYLCFYILLKMLSVRIGKNGNLENHNVGIRWEAKLRIAVR